ncbi:MAG TPA: 50S ribosomal protein L10 [Acidimicrobiia bacterium]
MALKADPTTEQVAKKAAVIDEISAKLREADAAVLTEYRGLTVTQIAELRAALRPTGTEYKIYKNTLVRRAATDAGFGDQLDTLLVGPVAVAFVKGDAAGAAKALRDFARATPALVLKGGVLGERSLSTGDVDALAELPPRDQLLSQIAGLFQAPLAQTASVLEALLRDTVGLVSALIDKHPEEAAASSADAAVPGTAAGSDRSEGGAPETAEPETATPEAEESAAPSADTPKAAPETASTEEEG